MFGERGLFGAFGKTSISDLQSQRRQLRRSTIFFLISAIALPGFNPFGQVRVQFRIVWER